MDYKVQTISRNDMNNKLDVNYNFADKKEFLMFCFSHWVMLRDDFNNLSKIKVKFEQIKQKYKLNNLTYSDFENILEEYFSHVVSENVDSMCLLIAVLGNKFFKNSTGLRNDFFKELSNYGETVSF